MANSDLNVFNNTLAQYRQAIDADISSYCGRLLHSTDEVYGAYSREGLANYCAILQRGGKRLRGALVMHAYYMLGGDDDQLALQAARAIEMAHAYFLVIDDICDNSAMRRGGPTAHVALADYHSSRHWHGNAARFGEAAAMSAALAGIHLAMLELGRLPVNDTVKLEAMNTLNGHFATTAYGQLNDIFDEAIQDVDEAQVQRVMLWKTAYYSFLSPLQLGAILAGAESADLSFFEEYAMHAGLSFQITDDILGTFGNEFESGKSARDDLKEGKATVLISRALQKSNSEQRQQLLGLLGKPDLTSAEYETCKQIVQDTGALDYARQLAKSHGEKAMLALQDTPVRWSKTSVQFLHDLVWSIVERRY